MELKDQLKQVQTDLEAERAKGAERNNDVVARLETQEADLLQQIMVERQNRLATIPTLSLADLKAWETELLNQDEIDTDALKAVQERIAELEQAQAHVERVTQATTDFNAMINNLDLGQGITLRQLIGEADYYQMAVIGIKGAFQAQADEFSKQIGELQRTNGDQSKSNDELRSKLAKLADENADISNQLHQEKLERANAEQTRDNAASQLEEANKEVARLKEREYELQQQLALGVKGSLAVVNSEEDKKLQEEIAAKFKREHTVYDVVADDPYNAKNYTAKLAYNDQSVTYSWIAKNSYTVLKSADEVNSFRTQYGSEPVAQDNHASVALDQPKASLELPTLEVTTFPVAPGSTMANEQPGVQTEGTTVEERVAALEKRVDIIWQHANIPGRVA